MRDPLVRLLEAPSPYPDLGCATRCTALVKTPASGDRACHGTGKGRSLHARRLSAVGEAVERHHFFHARPHRVATPDALEGPMVTPAQLGLPLHRPAGCDLEQPGSPQGWSLATDLSTGMRWWVPHEVGGAWNPHYRPTTSGWATHEPATAPLRALLEIVERDAALLAWYRADFGVEIGGLNDPVAAALDRRGFDLRLFLLTRDLPIPVVWAVARVRDSHAALQSGACLMSTAADLVPEVAVVGALDGVVQKLETFGQWPCDPFQGQPTDPHDHIRYYLEPRHGDELHARIGAPPMMPARELRKCFHLRDVQAMIRDLSARGLHPLVVDETQVYARQVNSVVCRAVIPGLLPLTFGPAGSGRLSRLPERIACADEAQRLISQQADLPPHPFA